jgi:hypothetical protein
MRKAFLVRPSFQPFLLASRRSLGIFSGIKSSWARPFPAGKPENAMRFTPASRNSERKRAPVPARMGTIA